MMKLDANGSFNGTAAHSSEDSITRNGEKRAVGQKDREHDMR